MIGANGRSVPEMAFPKAITISTSQELCMKRQVLHSAKLVESLNDSYVERNVQLINDEGIK